MLRILSSLGIVILFSFLLVPSVSAGPLEDLWNWLFGSSPEEETPLGSEYIDNYLHIWNQGDIATDYYYSGSCNQRLSNELGEQWEKVTIGLTYGSTKEDLLSNYVELQTGDCNVLNSSTEDSVNFTAWKDVSYIGKTGRLAKNSYLEVNDDYMKETFMFKSDEDINQDIWFVIGRIELDVSNNSNDNFIQYYNVGDNTPIIFNLSYTKANSITEYRNQDEVKQGFFIRDFDTSESITYSSDTLIDYYYIVNGSDIYLMYKAGTFSAGQTKKLETYWVDARCSCLPATDCSMNQDFPSGQIHDVDDTFPMRNKLTVLSGGCTGCYTAWEDFTTGSWAQIPISDTDLDCTGSQCKQNPAVENTWYTRTLECEGAGSYSARSDTEAVVCPPTGGSTITCNVLGVCTNSYTSGDFLVDEEVNCTAEEFGVNGMINITPNGVLYLRNNTNMTFNKSRPNMIWNPGKMLFFNYSKLVGSIE